jgi:hypothetical protein
LYAFAAFCLQTVARGQDNSLLTVLRGTVVQAAPSSDATGSFTIRTFDLRVELCTYDAGTYFERQAKPSTLPPGTGEQLEVISDRNGGRAVCHARAIRSLRLPATLQASRSASSYSSALDAIAPRGNIFVSGTIVSVTSENLVIRTRSQGNQTLRLRDDTRLLQDGVPALPADLIPNLTVFVRAGRTFDQTLEAFQVVWGQIVRPNQ